MNLSHPYPRHARRLRNRGSVYLLTLCMLMLVAMISFAGLLVARVQSRSSTAAGDFAAARLYARAGIEAAMFQMRINPTWRTDRGNGLWYDRVSLGQGDYSVTVADPLTGDLTLAANHPVVLTSTGRQGNAAYLLRTTINVQSSVVDCVGVSACAGTTVTLKKAVLTSNQIIAANATGASDGVTLNSGCVMNANVITPGNCSGSTYTKSISAPAAPLTLPDPVHVFDTYAATGTSIPLTSLLQSNKTEIVTNTAFASNAGWRVYSGSSTVFLTPNAIFAQSGSNALYVSNRASLNDLPATDLPLTPTTIRNGDTYAISMDAYSAGTGNVAATIVLQATGGTVSFGTPSTALKSGKWVTAKGNVTLAWSGTLTKATLVLATTNASSDLIVQNPTVTDASFGSSAYVLDQCLLSPTVNRYGTPNAQGLYTIDCGGKALTIQNCRIVGTLLILNSASSGVTINGPVTWEPALPNYPALLTAATININVNGSVALTESTLGVNLNPTGTPYPFASGTTNVTAADAFPSTFQGLIYSGTDVNLTLSPTLNGSLIAARSITVNGAGNNNATPNLTYSNAAYITPPPGFATGKTGPTPIPGSWSRVTR